MRRVPDSPAAMIREPSGVEEAERMLSSIPGRFWFFALRSWAEAVRSWLLWPRKEIVASSPGKPPCDFVSFPVSGFQSL